MVYQGKIKRDPNVDWDWAKTCHPLLYWVQMLRRLKGFPEPPDTRAAHLSAPAMCRFLQRRPESTWTVAAEWTRGKWLPNDHCSYYEAAGYYFSSLLSLVLAGTKHTSQESLPRSLCWLENDIKPDIELPSAKRESENERRGAMKKKKKKKRAAKWGKWWRPCRGRKRASRKARTNAVTDMQTTHWSTYAIIP